MYIPKHFQETDWPTIAQFIREFSFGLLVTTGADGLPVASHLPLELHEIDGQRVLRGHMAKANPQGKTFYQLALAIFSEPHAYVSSSWYNHLNVPTWNYVAVHVYGPVRILEGDELVAAMQSQVAKYEANRPNAFSIAQFTEKELSQHLRGVVGFEMTIEIVQAKYKLSQNRDEESYRNVIKELEKTDDVAAHRVADEMKKRRTDA